MLYVYGNKIYIYNAIPEHDHIWECLCHVACILQLFMNVGDKSAITETSVDK